MLKITKIKPMFTSIITTGEKFSEEMFNEAGLIENKKGDLKTYQRVIAIGPMVRDIKVGDMVAIDVSHYAIRKYDPNSIKNDMDMNKTISYAFNWVTIDDDEGKPMDCLMLQDRDILFSFEGKEVQGKKPSSLIVPKKKKLVVN